MRAHNFDALFGGVHVHLVDTMMIHAWHHLRAWTPTAQVLKWTTEFVQVPKQANGFDCGVHMLATVDR